MSRDQVTHALDQQVNSKRIEEVDDCFDPTDQLLMSIAVSLKRIADAMTGVGPSILTAPINSYGEGIGDAIQGQMIRAQRGIDQYEGLK